MLDDGLFTRFPKPDMALALHCDATLETGKIGYRPGYSLANVDSVDITMHGRGGHGASPHATIDPIVQAAQFIVSLQTLVSREIEPIEPAVVTVGSIHGGTKHNVIPDDCHLQLTVRSFADEVRATTARRHPPQGQRRGGRRRRARADDRSAQRIRRRRLFNDEKLVDACCARRFAARWATTMWCSRSLRWGARTSAATAGPGCRSSCFAWDRSSPIGWPV